MVIFKSTFKSIFKSMFFKSIDMTYVRSEINWNNFQNSHISEDSRWVFQAAQRCSVKMLFHWETPVAELYYRSVAGFSSAVLL